MEVEKRSPGVKHMEQVVVRSDTTGREERDRFEKMSSEQVGVIKVKR